MNYRSNLFYSWFHFFDFLHDQNAIEYEILWSVARSSFCHSSENIYKAPKIFRALKASKCLDSRERCLKSSSAQFRSIASTRQYFKLDDFLNSIVKQQENAIYHFSWRASDFALRIHCIFSHEKFIAFSTASVTRTKNVDFIFNCFTCNFCVFLDVFSHKVCSF